MMVLETIQNIIVVILIVAVIFGVALIPYSMGESVGYRKGQIDALNGKLYYRLEKQEDSEFKWVECPDVCNYEKEE